MYKELIKIIDQNLQHLKANSRFNGGTHNVGY